MPAPDQVPWTNRYELSRHFRKHGHDLGRSSEDDYDASARATIRAGRRFTYMDTTTGERRIGYYHAATERFTALNGTETRILTHYRCPARYVRHLPQSDYVR